MAIPTLQEAKSFLRIEVDYFDAEIGMLLNGAVFNAENLTGRNYTNTVDIETYEIMPDAIKEAVLHDVATGFDQRQNNTKDSESESVNASIYTYRQHSKTPMF